MIITIEELKTLGRPLGDVKADKLNAYIREVENTQVKPALGDALYLDLTDETKASEPAYSMLLNGGTYTDKAGYERIFSGLKVAMSYYVYVKILMSGDLESTRYGFVEKNGQYSSHISTSARSAAYSEAMEVANQYFKECIAYCKATDLIQHDVRKGAVSGGLHIHKVG